MKYSSFDANLSLGEMVHMVNVFTLKQDNAWFIKGIR